MQTGFDWAHLIDQGGSTRLREVYGAFDAAAVARLLGTGQTARVAALESGDSGTGSVTGSGTVTAAVAASRDDAESYGGVASDDLDLGETTTAAGKVANDVALRFTGLALDAGAEIESAYLLFEAKRAGDAGGTLAIAVADDLGRAGFSPGGGSRGARLARRDRRLDPGRLEGRGGLPLGRRLRPRRGGDRGGRARRPRRARLPHHRHRQPFRPRLGLGRDGPGPRHRPGLTSTAPAGAAGTTAFARGFAVGLPALARPRASRGGPGRARGLSSPASVLDQYCRRPVRDAGPRFRDSRGPPPPHHRRDEMRHHLAVQLSRRAPGDRALLGQGAGVLLGAPGPRGARRPLPGPLGLRPRPPRLCDGGLDRLHQVARAGVAERIHAYGIRPKLVYMVRDPFARIESHYNFMLHDPAWEARGMTDESLVQNSDYAALGSTPTRRCSAAENLLLLDYDELVADPTRAVNRVCGLPRHRADGGDRRHLGPQRHRAAALGDRAADSAGSPPASAAAPRRR